MMGGGAVVGLNSLYDIEETGDVFYNLLPLIYSDFNRGTYFLVHQYDGRRGTVRQVCDITHYVTFCDAVTQFV